MLINQAKKVGGLRHSWQINVRDAAAVRRQVADDDFTLGRNAFNSNCKITFKNIAIVYFNRHQFCPTGPTYFVIFGHNKAPRINFQTVF